MSFIRLHDEYRRVIIMRLEQDSTCREVAEIVGQSVPAVRVIQHRALNALCKEMQLDEEQRSAANV